MTERREAVNRLIDDLARKRVTLFVENNSIKYSGPHALDNDDIEKLRSFKPGVISLLEARAAAKGLPALKQGAELTRPSAGQVQWWNWIGFNTKEETHKLPCLVAFSKDASPQKLDDAIQRLIDKHDILKSSYSTDGGKLVVKVDKEKQFEIQHERLEEAYPGDTDQIGLSKSIDDFVTSPLPSNGQWLVKAKAVQLSKNLMATVLVLNHIIADNASKAILKADLRRILTGEGKEERRPQFADYVNFEDEWLRSSSNPLLNYWKDWISDIPVTKSRSGNPLSWRPGTRIAFNFRASSHFVEMANSIAKNNATSSFVVYLTTFSISLSKWSGQKRFAVRSIRDGRVVPALSTVVGNLGSSDVLDINIDTTANFEKTLEKIKQQYNAAVLLRNPVSSSFPHLISINGEKDISPPDNVTVAINFISQHDSNKVLATRLTRSGLSDPNSLQDPIIFKPATEQLYSINISPLSLVLFESGEGMDCSVRFSKRMISYPDQRSLISIFTSELRTLYGRSREG